MARPLKWYSHQGATTTGPGRNQQTKGHNDIGFYVKVYNGFDPGTDTLEVRVEGSHTSEHYAPIDRGAPAVEDALFVNGTDLVQSDEDSTVYITYIGVNSFAVSDLRANIVSHSGGFEVDTVVFVNGGPQGARRYSTPDGPG